MEIEAKKFAVKFARDVIENFVKNKTILKIPKNYPQELNSKKGVFVTLFKKENGNEILRGCIGLPYPQKSSIKNLQEAAIGATMDLRFNPLQEQELKDLIIEISVLDEPKKIEAKKPQEYLKKIVPYKDGLIIEKNKRSGLFLPQVWETFSDKTKFLFNLCLKAGLSPNDWMLDGITLYKFQIEKIREDEL